LTGLVTPGALTLCCSDMAAPPLFWTEADGSRHGYEPGAAGAVAGALGLELHWIFRQWADFARALAEGECDGIWCGSAITPERETRFLYTRPYAVFDESVAVRAGDAVGAASDLHGRRVGAIAGSTNMALAETFEGAVCVPFDGVTDDVFGDMLRALQVGEVDAVVDDDVAFLGIERSYPDIRVAFTVATRNPWGCALPLGEAELKDALDHAIAQADLPAVWRQWLPTLSYPL
jgi:polar amino acid transport system substrate-binding protein